MVMEEVVEGSEPAVDIEESDSGLVERRQQLDACRKAVNRDPRNVKLLNKLGLAAEAAGDNDRARWAYKRSVRLDPTYGPAYQNLGFLLKREGQVKQAILVLENCLKYASLDYDQDAVHQALEQLWLGVEDTESDAAKMLDKMLQPKESGKDPDIVQIEKALEAEHAAGRPLAEIGLTPAEALLLLDPDGSDPRRMVGYTALDLINKEILSVNNRGEIRRGPRFEDGKLEPHETFLVSYFNRFDRGVDLTQYANVILNRLGNRYDVFKADLVRRVMIEKGYLRIETTRWLGIIPVRHYTLTDKGKRLLHDLQRQLTQAAAHARRLRRRDP